MSLSNNASLRWRAIRWLLILPLISLVGCGFTLRGAIELPVYLSPILVEAPRLSTNLAVRLRQSLESQGIQVVATQQAAATVLSLEKDQYKRSVLTVGTDGKAREYLLQYRVYFSVSTPSGGVYLQTTEMLMERDLRFDANNVTASTTEEFRLKEAMVEDAVLQILRRLQYIKPLGSVADS